MGFSCGIIGLPNIGKSTLFNALTDGQVAAENYAFCTVAPNHGVAPVPDERLVAVAACFSPEKITPTSLEFVDIAGLVKGAAEGEGLGNQFLGQIAAVDAIAHVVRCFEDDNVTHVHGQVNPVDDVEVVETELLLRDLEMAESRLEKQRKVAKGGDKEAKQEVAALEPVVEALRKGQAVRELNMAEEQQIALKATPFLTAKPILFIANVSEDQLNSGVDEALSALARKQKAELVVISAAIEAELNDLEPADRKDYMAELGLSTRGLDAVVQAGYVLLDLVTFFTTVGTEVRAWTVPKGTIAPKAAGKIHSDMERGFIRAEVIQAPELISLGSEQAAREKGLLRLEGKDYQVQDGDVIRFRFNV